MLNPWAWWQYAHNMSGAVITGAFVMAAVGASTCSARSMPEQGRIFVRVGVIAALVVSVFQLLPTGDAQGRMLARNQPVTLAAMEGACGQRSRVRRWSSSASPTCREQKIDNPLVVPKMLSFLT